MTLFGVWMKGGKLDSERDVEFYLEMDVELSIVHLRRLKRSEEKELMGMGLFNGERRTFNCTLDERRKDRKKIERVAPYNDRISKFDRVFDK